MKKVKLQNMQSMSQLTSHGPLDRSLNLNENGRLNDSGVIDESGIIDISGLVYDVQTGYDYTYATVESISVRYVIIWHRSRTDFNATISLDDGTTNPYASGYIGDPITNTDTDHNEFVKQRIQTAGTSGTGTFTASWTIEYIHYPCGRDCTIGPDCTPKYRYASGIITFEVPPYVEEEE